ncbi:hypothetical protein BGZ94_005171, partial [Podila epigama]
KVSHQDESRGKRPSKINTTDIAGVKVENWYISNRARLDPKTRRLVVKTQATTARQKHQLKLMRKHHWECGMEIENSLRRLRPTSYSLKIPRQRIDWIEVSSYVALMLQARSPTDDSVTLSTFRQNAGIRYGIFTTTVADPYLYTLRVSAVQGHECRSM